MENNILKRDQSPTINMKENAGDGHNTQSNQNNTALMSPSIN